MKHLVILTAAFLLVLGSCYGQTDRKKDDQAKYRNIPGKIEVNKKYDENGNLIQYDSTYTWSSSDTYPDSLFKGNINRFDLSRFFSDHSFFGHDFFNFTFPGDSSFIDRSATGEDFFKRFFSDRSLNDRSLPDSSFFSIPPIGQFPDDEFFRYFEEMEKHFHSLDSAGFGALRRGFRLNVPPEAGNKPKL
jgi:hypothetical protein